MSPRVALPSATFVFDWLHREPVKASGTPRQVLSSDDEETLWPLRVQPLMEFGTLIARAPAFEVLTIRIRRFRLCPAATLDSDYAIELAAERFREANQFVREDLDSFAHFLVLEFVAFKGAAGRINEARDDYAAEIEHEAIRECHDRHVTAHSARSAEKSDHLLFPGASGQLDEVLRGGADIVVINRRSHQDAVSRFDRLAHFLGSRLGVTGIGVAQGQAKLADIEPGAFGLRLFQMSESDPTHSTAVAVGIAAGAYDKITGHGFLKRLIRLEAGPRVNRGSPAENARIE
jgi:hypothetical protein